MAYCCRCGVYAALDDVKMCRACRDGWRPAGSRPGDLGYRGQPQPLGPRPAVRMRRVAMPADRRARGAALILSLGVSPT